MFGIGEIELLIMIPMLLVFYVIPLIVLGFVVRWAVSSGVREGMALSNRGRANLSAIEILDQRYASGELAREEYQNIRGDITKESNAR